MSDKRRLNDDELERVSGGAIFDKKEIGESGYEVINESDWNVVSTFDTYEEAWELATRGAYGTDRIHWPELDEKRKSSKKHE